MIAQMLGILLTQTAPGCAQVMERNRRAMRKLEELKKCDDE
jgi:hypothetical protein